MSVTVSLLVESTYPYHTLCPRHAIVVSFREHAKTGLHLSMEYTPNAEVLQHFDLLKLSRITRQLNSIDVRHFIYTKSELQIFLCYLFRILLSLMLFKTKDK